jgi:thiamine-monophosphate kinase
VVSVDSVVDGVHFDLTLCSPRDVGWKALMGALSDLAAMGARPIGALVALCVPSVPGQGALALAVMEGVAEAATDSDCPVIGGDVSSASQLVVAVTVIGVVESGQAVARTGAMAGDVVMVTGPCGGSAAGLRQLRAGESGGEAYRRPVARLSEGTAARLAGAHAMIDVSDGLALDLHRLADASGVGFILSTIPVADGATREEALGGGEDYELLMTFAPTDVAAFEQRCEATGLRPPLAIGDVLADPQARLLNGDALDRKGWQHTLG